MVCCVAMDTKTDLKFGSVCATEARWLTHFLAFHRHTLTICQIKSLTMSRLLQQNKHSGGGAKEQEKVGQQTKSKASSEPGLPKC